MGKILNVNERSYPNQNDPWNGIAIVVVLVEGDIGDYAAYAGHGYPDWVAQHGDKISFEEAQVHFPIGLVKEKYRG